MIHEIGKKRMKREKRSTSGEGRIHTPRERRDRARAHGVGEGVRGGAMGWVRVSEVGTWGGLGCQRLSHGVGESVSDGAMGEKMRKEMQANDGTNKKRTK